MAKLVDPLLSQSASGSIGGALSYGNRLGKNIVRAYSRPKRQRTYAQGQQSERYQAYKNEWNLLYPVRKAVFSARAVEQGRVSGFHQFLHENLQPDMVGQTLLTPKQVGLWHFNTGSGGTAYDATQYHNDGTLQGPVWTPGKYGDGLYFDGVNDYVNFVSSSSFALSYGRVSGWFRVTSSQAQDGYLISFGADARRITAHIDLSNIFHFIGLRLFSFYFELVTPFSVNDSLWHSFLGSFDSVKASLYIDNNFISETLGDMNIAMAGTAFLNIGRFYESDANYFKGYVDDIAISRV